MPETKIYSIYVPFDSGRLNGKTDNSITILVHAPRYLKQPYIAYRESPYHLKISKYSKWDESPDEIVKTHFKDSLYSTGLFQDVRTSNIVSGSIYSLKIDLKGFERYDEGKDSFGELIMDVVLFSPDMKVLYQDNIIKKVKLDDRDFLSLAKGLSIALTELIAEVRNNIVQSILNMKNE
jgi:ABC-type uncharacterized transport system auxiliary subunit